LTGVFDKGCERAQEWASLELDGELSQLERVLLATHLRRCAACAETVAGIRSLTTALRAAPFEPLGEPAFVAAAESRRAHPLAVRLALAATLAVVAAGLGMFAGTLGDTSPSQGPPPGPDQPLALLPDAKKDVQGLRPNKRESRDEVGFGSTELFGGV
jgi:predicted anti-sigma-YlaC factor YlaD